MIVLGFTIFNTITVLILAGSVALLIERVRLRLKGNWPLVYYGCALAYALAFPYSLNLYAVAAGILCALLLRFQVYRKEIRIAEAAILLYVIWRSVALLLGW